MPEDSSRKCSRQLVVTGTTMLCRRHMARRKAHRRHLPLAYMYKIRRYRPAR